MPKKWPNKHETNWEVISQPKWWRFKNFVNRIWDALWFPNNEKAWNKFPEDVKKEMLESLKRVDTMNLYSLKLDDLWENTISRKWDIIDFKEWIVQKDEIWKYITINWTKCREYQPWISWFVYENIRSKRQPNNRLRIWFCDKWEFKKSVIIDTSLWAEKRYIPSDVSKQLWWPFYLQEDTETPKEGPLHNISWYDIYHVENENEDYWIWPKYIINNIDFKDEIIHKNGSKTSLKINWTTFKEYTPWCSWFAYKGIYYPDKRDGYCLLLAEFKDWKMVWEWVIITKYKWDIYHITNGK